MPCQMVKVGELKSILKLAQWNELVKIFFMFRAYYLDLIQKHFIKKLATSQRVVLGANVNCYRHDTYLVIDLFL